MNVKEQAIEFIKAHEKLRLQADYVGDKFVVGYGNAISTYNGEVVTQEQAEQTLAKQVVHIGNLLDKNLIVELTDNQRVALTSLIHDVGYEDIVKSDIFPQCNRRNFIMVASILLTFNKLGRTVSVHKSRRRNAERTLFLTNGE